MPKRSRTMLDEEGFSFLTDCFSPFPTTDGLGTSPDGDMTWAFDMDTDPTHTVHDMDIPMLQPLGDAHDLLSYQDLRFVAGYQTSNGSSSLPSSGSTSGLTCLSSCSPPGLTSTIDAQPHTGQTDLCVCRAESCVQSALRMLATLRIAHSACLSAHQDAPTTEPARSMETVLSMNKDVIASMSPILACACSGKSLAQLLLAVICGNLIAWNGAMIVADFEHTDPNDSPRSNFSSISSLSSGSMQTSKARVLAQPITIGQHQIDGNLGRALRAQVMAGEISVLEGLVDTLDRRFSEVSKLEGISTISTTTQMRNINCQVAPAGHGSTIQSKSLSYNIHRHIISSLQTRLQTTRSKIFSRLSGAD